MSIIQVTDRCRLGVSYLSPFTETLKSCYQMHETSYIVASSNIPSMSDKFHEFISTFQPPESSLEYKIFL